MRRGESRQDYATPPEFFSACEKKFGPINFDLAASAHNTKCAHYFSKRDNSLAQEWHKIPGILYLNPPFDPIEPWAAKCSHESKLGAKILLLVPASVGSNWFRDHVFHQAHVYFLNGRIPFDPEHPKWGYPKDCVLIEYGFRALAACDFEIWNWKTP